MIGTMKIYGISKIYNRNYLDTGVIWLTEWNKKVTGMDYFEFRHMTRYPIDDYSLHEADLLYEKEREDDNS